MSGLTRTIRAFGILATANILGQLLGFVALAYVARRAGPVGLGAYTFDLVLATYVGLSANLGVSYLATRDIAKAPESATRAIWEVLLIQGSLSLAVYGLLVLAAPALTRDAQTRMLLPVIALTVPVTAFTLDWVLLALRRSTTLGVWRLVGQVVYAALVFLVIRHRHVVLRYSEFNVCGLAVTMLGVGVALRAGLRRAPRRPDLRGLARRIRRSAPFGYSLLMLQVYAAIAIPLLGYLSSTRSVGIYSVAFRLPAALISLANVWLAVFFPHSAQRLVRSSAGFLKELGQVLTATATVSLAIAVAATLCARDLMPALFGARFQASAGPFALLSVAAALVLLQATTSNALLASGNERRYARIITAVAIGLTLLDLAAIPLFGAVGASCASVVAETAIVALTFWEVRNRLGRFDFDWKRIRRGALSVAIMAAATAVARTTHTAGLEVAVAVLFFVVGSVGLRAFDSGLLRGDAK